MMGIDRQEIPDLAQVGKDVVIGSVGASAI